MAGVQMQPQHKAARRQLSRVHAGHAGHAVLHKKQMSAPTQSLLLGGGKKASLRMNCGELR